MREFDLANNVAGLSGLASVDITADGDTVGEIVDVAGFHSLTWAVDLSGLTDGAFTFAVYQGDEADLSDAVAVDAGEVLRGDEVTAAGVAIVGTIGKKRYQRLTITATGVATGATGVSAIALLGTPLHAPVA